MKLWGKVWLRFMTIAALAAAAALPGAAQYKDGTQSVTIDLPRTSQKAVVTQRVGVTDITVTYSRPLANKRVLWGKEVPYGQVWRAGANENTTIEISDPVTVEGQPLAAGKYGLHMIPNESEWTVIFSKANASWGSFSYKPEEDALRVNVKPHAAEMREALTYDFDLPSPDTATMNLRWAKVEVPVQIKVDVSKTALASVHRQMRGLQMFNPQSGLEAAKYLYENNAELDQALTWANGAAQAQPDFQSLLLKSQIETALNRNADAAASRKQALALAQPLQLYNYARGLQISRKDNAGAFEIFRTLSQKFPEHWVARLANARLRSSESKFDAARSEMKLALEGAPDPIKPQIENLMKRLEANQDINQ